MNNPTPEQEIAEIAFNSYLISEELNTHDYDRFYGLVLEALRNAENDGMDIEFLVEKPADYIIGFLDAYY